MSKEFPQTRDADMKRFEAALVLWLRAEQAAGTDTLGIGIFAQSYMRVADAVERGELRAFAEHIGIEKGRVVEKKEKGRTRSRKGDPVARSLAAKAILN